MDKNFQKIVKLLEQENLLHNVNNITIETSINEDLMIDGEDAYEFLKKYSHVFNVDISEFPFNKYFGNEGWGCLTFFLSFFNKKEFNQVLPLKIQDLIEGIECGKLPRSVDI